MSAMLLKPESRRTPWSYLLCDFMVDRRVRPHAIIVPRGLNVLSLLVGPFEGEHIVTERNEGLTVIDWDSVSPLRAGATISPGIKITLRVAFDHGNLPDDSMVIELSPGLLVTEAER